MFFLTKFLSHSMYLHFITNYKNMTNYMTNYTFCGCNNIFKLKFNNLNQVNLG